MIKVEFKEDKFYYVNINTKIKLFNHFNETRYITIKILEQYECGKMYYYTDESKYQDCKFITKTFNVRQFFRLIIKTEQNDYYQANFYENIIHILKFNDGIYENYSIIEHKISVKELFKIKKEFECKEYDLRINISEFINYLENIIYNNNLDKDDTKKRKMNFK